MAAEQATEVTQVTTTLAEKSFEFLQTNLDKVSSIVKDTAPGCGTLQSDTFTLMRLVMLQ
jgi:prophage DNA circulation protein